MTLGKKHFLTISAMNNLGLLYQDMGRYQEAASLHEACLSLLKADEPNPIAYATTLNNLTTAYTKLGKPEQIESLLLEALAIYGNELGQSHPLYAAGINNLASHYYKTGKLSQAQDFFLQSAGICRSVFGEESRNYASTLTNLAIVCEQLGQQVHAAEYYRAAAAIMRHLFGENSSHYQKLVNKL